MPDPKGDKLFVNVGASQARRRLKGFGHGVRKVQTAGRNQAVIIHTATGRHLQELEAKFADVGFAASSPPNGPTHFIEQDLPGGVNHLTGEVQKVSGTNGTAAYPTETYGEGPSSALRGVGANQERR